jgi:hypothetical protein
VRPKAAAPLRASSRARLATERRQSRMLRKVAAASEAPARPEAASSAVLRPSVLRPKAAARPSDRSEGRTIAPSQQTCVMWSEQLEIIAWGSDVPLEPKAQGALRAPDEFLSIYSPFNLISDPPVRSGCSAQPGGPSLIYKTQRSKNEHRFLN